MFIVFDTETTGLPTSRFANPETNVANWNSCRLVQIAWCVYDGSGSVIEDYVAIVKPKDFIIPPSNYHFITHDIAMKKGKAAKTVLNNFVKVIEKYPGCILIAHNYKFDHDVVVSEMARLKMNSGIKTINESNNHCTMINLTTGGRKYISLGEAYRNATGKSLENAHDALVDVHACATVFMASQYGQQFLDFQTK